MSPFYSREFTKEKGRGTRLLRIPWNVPIRITSCVIYPRDRHPPCHHLLRLLLGLADATSRQPLFSLFGHLQIGHSPFSIVRKPNSIYAIGGLQFSRRDQLRLVKRLHHRAVNDA